MQRKTRVALLPIEEVLPLLQDMIIHSSRDDHKSSQVIKISLAGEMVTISNGRLRTFARDSLKETKACCTDCGLQPAHFALEALNVKEWGIQTIVHQLHMYGLDPEGQEVLFTHDHTVARALGGDDSLSNTTTMCYPCNNRKALLEGILVEDRTNENYRSPAPALLTSLMTALAANGSKTGVGFKKVGQLTRNFEVMAYIKGMGIEEYREHCNQWTDTVPASIGHVGENPDKRAAVLGLSRHGLDVFWSEFTHQPANTRSLVEATLFGPLAGPQPTGAPKRTLLAFPSLQIPNGWTPGPALAASSDKAMSGKPSTPWLRQPLKLLHHFETMAQAYGMTIPEYQTYCNSSRPSLFKKGQAATHTGKKARAVGVSERGFRVFWGHFLEYQVISNQMRNQAGALAPDQEAAQAMARATVQIQNAGPENTQDPLLPHRRPKL